MTLSAREGPTPSAPGQDGAPSGQAPGWTATLAALVARTGAVAVGVAMGYQVFQQTRSSLLVGLVAASFGVPFACASLVTGHVRQRVGLPVMIAGAFVVRVVGLLVLASVASTSGNDTFWLVVISINSGLAGALIFVGTQLVIHELEAPEKLHRSVLASAVVLSSAAVIGPTAAGFLIQAHDVAPVYLIAGACFVPSGIVFVFFAMRVRADERAQRARLREAVRFVREIPVLQWAVVTAILAGVLADPLIHLMPAVVKSFNRDAADRLGVLTTCIALGSMGQVLLLGRFGSRHDPRVIVTAAYAAAGALLLGIAFDSELYVAPALLILFGLSAGIGKALLLPTVHVATPHSHRHHVLALYTFVTAAATPIAALLWGICAQIVGIDATTGGAGIALMGLMGLAALRRRARTRPVGARYAAQRAPTG